MKMRLAIWAVVALIGMAGGGAAHAQQANLLLNPITWPRMPVDRFGCLLERELSYRDGKFNCALTGYRNKGTPCVDIESYFEGPAFPLSRVARVAPILASIEIAYQAGQVRAVTLVLKDRLSVAQIRQQLRLPPLEALPSHVSSVRFDGCRAGSDGQVCNVVLIEGFEHQGAGDVDCGGDDATPEPTEAPRKD